MKNTKRHRTTFVLILLFLIYQAQGQQDDRRYWYFGNNTGLDFSFPVQQVLNNSAMTTYDCSSTISDSVGKLLFYTNGVTVWNSQHLVMTNGSGLNGSNSGGQSAIIVRQPGTNFYYIFTVALFGTGNCYYSVVDITGSGGLGTVVQKNILLFNSTTEKLAVYYNCAIGGFWIMGHEYGSNHFLAYQLTSAGLNITPVTSAVGNIHSGGSFGGEHDALGQMTISPDGNLIATAQDYNDVVQLFQFDKTTGIVSNPVSIPFPSAWGIAFSPNSQVMYLTQWGSYNTVKQVDISIPSSPGTPAVIGNTTGAFGGYGAGYMELAPNNKIIIAKYGATSLSVINNPDVLGNGCNFVDNGIPLNGGVSQAGLSRAGYIATPQFSLASNLNCNQVTLSLVGATPTTSATWEMVLY